ncbi:hypothetical protein EVAR_55747_1 [Eumeta japonica]|uniref:Uncharacterized protein n=1 Tax=Eumeta variegata TaxID=151549 RepID=A0A4C1XEK5_EUMVA|nr:hypothetical protein EVAR_55747_1 [Eumeta japonica]
MAATRRMPCLFYRRSAEPSKFKLLMDWTRNIAWPPGSPDFTLTDFFLWGTLHQRVYAIDINTRDELVERILVAADEIRASPGIIRRTTSSVALRATM